MAWLKPDPRDLALTPQQAKEKWNAARDRIAAAALPIQEEESRASPLPTVPTPAPIQRAVVKKSAPDQPTKPSIEGIIEAVVKYYNHPEVTAVALREERLTKGTWRIPLAQAKRLSCLVAYEVGWNFYAIGQAFGGRHKKSIRNMVETCEREVDRNPSLKKTLREIMDTVREE